MAKGDTKRTNTVGQYNDRDGLAFTSGAAPDVVRSRVILRAIEARAVVRLSFEKLPLPLFVVPHCGRCLLQASPSVAQLG